VVEPLASAPVLIGGPSSSTLYVRGAAAEVATAAIGLPFLVLQTVLPGPTVVWLVLGLVIAFMCIAVGMILGFYGYFQDKREQAAGYTTSPPTARKNSQLFLVQPVTHEVVLRPHQPRPDSMRDFVQFRDIFRKSP
jgi:hypothetical protein